MSIRQLVRTAIVLLISVGPAAAQWTAEKPGSDNIEVLSHIPLGPRLSVSDTDIEQEMDRPYAYVGRTDFGTAGEKGIDIIDLSDPTNAKRIYSWRIENQDLHLGAGGMDVKHFKWKDRYYVVQSLQFRQGGPDPDLGAVVLDVTGLPDPATVKEVARIREPDYPGGFHNIFIYKHSNGAVLLFTTVAGPFAHVYDLGSGRRRRCQKRARRQSARSDRGGIRARRPNVRGVSKRVSRFLRRLSRGYRRGFASMVAAPVATTSTTSPTLSSRSFSSRSPASPACAVGTRLPRRPTVAMSSPRPSISTLRSASSTSSRVSTARSRAFRVRSARGRPTGDISCTTTRSAGPTLFVSGYLDGLQVFSLMDPTNPTTVAYYDTYTGPPNTAHYAVFNGAFGVDVRNEDGLIVISDMTTGFWVFRMEGFQGWNGEDWGMPNISSAQDWDKTPAEGTDSNP